MTPKAILAAALFAFTALPVLADPPGDMPPARHTEKHSPSAQTPPAGATSHNPERMAGPGRDSRNQGPARPGREDKATHDRYWRKDYHGFADSGRIIAEARKQGYGRHEGQPLWKDGRFVLKSTDRKGKPVFLEFNPYTGSFIGVIR